MTMRRRARILLALALTAISAVALVFALRVTAQAAHTTVTAYFENSNGLYPGDDVRIAGVPVGKVESIAPQHRWAKITFWIDEKYKVPANATAVILSPTLVTARFIQLTPAYTSGPQLPNNAVIPRERTAVPVEWDDLRTQLAKLNTMLQPTKPGGVSTAGELLNTLANNIRGQGENIRDTLVKLSQALSTLGDHSGDIFSTVKNLAVLVSALHDSTDVMRRLNQNLAAVTALLADDPNQVGAAIADLNTAVDDVRSFVADNREPLGIASDRLSELSNALRDSLDDVKKGLHVFPTAVSNFVNVFQPAHASVNGVMAGSNFANPLQFICGAVEAASRLGAEQSAKLCVQYMAPIIKNRQYNFLGPIGLNGAPLITSGVPALPVTAAARPNEVTFSEDWMRPDFVPPVASADPAASLPGMMLPPGGGHENH